MSASVLADLGPALQWLRHRRNRKQYEVALEAGVTKGMLSGYESGRQRPSIESLDAVLATLGCSLFDLHNALQVVNGRPEAMAFRGSSAMGLEEPVAGRVRALAVEILRALPSSLPDDAPDDAANLVRCGVEP